MKKLITIFFVCLMHCSCRKPCDEVKDLRSASIDISFFHRGTNEYFYPETAFFSPYNKDSLTLMDSDGMILIPSFAINQDRNDPLKRFYEAGIGPLFNFQTDKDAFSKERTKYLYIRYNYNTADTLKLIYKARDTKCGNTYEYLKVFYRDTLIASTTNDYFTEFILNH